MSDEGAVTAAVRAVEPDVIINCAAYNDVDGAEQEPGEALRVNTFGVSALACAARQHGATLVHYSTDFVFDGETTRPYTEEDRPNPRGLYAASKLLGDWFAADAPRAYVLRVESLFGHPGPGRARRGSLGTIVDRIRAGEEVPVFVDRTVSPGYTADIAWATRAALERGIPPGLYHCVNSGGASWARIADEVGAARRPPVAHEAADARVRRAGGSASALLRPLHRQACRGGDCDASVGGCIGEISQSLIPHP